MSPCMHEKSRMISNIYSTISLISLDPNASAALTCHIAPIPARHKAHLQPCAPMEPKITTCGHARHGCGGSAYCQPCGSGPSGRRASRRSRRCRRGRRWLRACGTRTACFRAAVLCAWATDSQRKNPGEARGSMCACAIRCDKGE